MRVVLHPAEILPHLSFLRATPGAYEWWYFDAVSSDERYVLACIWFLGNPFSPYYRLATRGENPDPFQHNALFFALYEGNNLHAYHFSRFRAGEIGAAMKPGALLRFGPNTLNAEAGRYVLSLQDENANRRTMDARLTFTAPPLSAYPDAQDDGTNEHLWYPAAPDCAVAGHIDLRGLADGKVERLLFQGHGYHDHNRGRLPFARSLRDWYWARTILDDGSALIVYHVRHSGGKNTSHLLRFQNGNLLRHDAHAHVRLSRPTINAFGRIYHTRMDVVSGDWNARFSLRGRLDSAPFYVRSRTDAALMAAEPLCVETVWANGSARTRLGRRW